MPEVEIALVNAFVDGGLGGNPAGVVLEGDRFTPAQRQALELAYFKGHTYRQVADLLGIPEGTAKSRLRLALQRIAEALEPEVTEQWA